MVWKDDFLSLIRSRDMGDVDRRNLMQGEWNIGGEGVMRSLYDSAIRAGDSTICLTVEQCKDIIGELDRLRDKETP